MTSRTTAGAIASLLSLALLTGCGEGKKGAAGEPGAPGPTGPLGPAAEPPRIDSVSPRFISAGSNVRIRGAHFSPNAADNVVFANGTVGTVISATDTEIWATGLDAGEAQSADITVRSLDSISNPWTVRAGKSGDVEFIEPIAPELPRSLALDAEEAWLYVGDDNDGVYRIALEGGAIEKIASLSGRSQNVVKLGPDGKIYVAGNDTDGTNRIDRLEADGTLTLISQNQVFSVTLMTWDPAGNLYLADSNGDVYRRDADGQAFNYFGISDILGQSPAGLEWAGDLLYIVHSSGDIEGYDASGATAVYVTNASNVQNPKATSTDGISLFVLVDDANGSVRRVLGFSSIPVLSSNPEAVGGLQSGYSSLERTAEGEFFFADPFNNQRIVASSKEGALSSWYENPTSSYYDMTEVGGDYFYGFGEACYDGMLGGGTMLRVTADGAVSRFVENLCAEELAPYGASIVALDLRGELIAITTTGVATRISDDPNLFGAYTMGVDADGNVYVGAYDAALGEGKIIKVSADGATVDPAFVTGLLNEPSSFAHVGSDLYFSDYYQLQKVPAATGGTPTVVIPYDVGFEAVYGVSAGRDGDVLFVGVYLGSQFAEFALRPDGNIEYASDLVGFDGIGIDSFNNYYMVDGDIAVELP